MKFNYIGRCGEGKVEAKASGTRAVASTETSASPYLAKANNEYTGSKTGNK